MANITTTKNKVTFSMQMSSPAWQKMIVGTLQDKQRAARFTASIVSAVSVNPALQECEGSTILAGALLGESLNLSPSPQLGQYYLVPFKNTKRGTTEAAFVLGYKGYVQLALRSGYYKKLNVIAIKEGELINYDALNEEIEVSLITDEAEREKAKTIGYYAIFEYLNGFRKAMYWSREKMISHADQYSNAFSKNAVKAKDPKYNKVSFADYEAGRYDPKDAWLYSSFWYKDFDGMAYKTMLRQLISKWGIMSTELEQAYTNDMAVLRDGQPPEYFDIQPDEPIMPETAPTAPAEEATEIDLTQI